LNKFSAATTPLAGRICVFYLLLALSYPGNADAELSAQGSVALSEEYNDNILLQRVKPLEDFVTTVTPSVAFTYRAPIWTWEGYSSLEARHFYEHSTYDGFSKTAHVQNQSEIIRSFFYITASEDYRKVSIDVATDYTQQGLIVNQTYQNTAVVNPFVVFRLTETTNLRIGHTFFDLRFRSALGVNRTDNIDYIEAGSALSTRMSLSVGVQRISERNTVENFEQLEGYASLNYTYGLLSSVSGRIAQSAVRYESGADVRQFLWNGNISQSLGSTTVTLSSFMQYVQDPRQASTRAESYSGVLLHHGSRTELTLTATATDYFTAAVNERTSSSREVRGEIAYRLTSRTTCKAFTGYQRLDNRTLGGTTYSTLATLRLEHRLTEALSLAAEYRYFNSYSAQLVDNNYRVNRGIIELRTIF
jgi:hypothetical protein